MEAVEEEGLRDAQRDLHEEQEQEVRVFIGPEHHHATGCQEREVEQQLGQAFRIGELEQAFRSHPQSI